MHQLNCVIYKEGDYFVSRCLDVEVASFGDTQAEARQNLQEALELYFEDNGNPKLSIISQPILETVSIGA
jgi:predicted RNase H-like HicB family nuclease